MHWPTTSRDRTPTPSRACGTASRDGSDHANGLSVRAMGRQTSMTELAPQERPKRSPRLVPWLLVPLTLLAVVGAWFAFHPGFRWGPSGAHLAAAMPKDEFERRVRAYLLESRREGAAASTPSRALDGQ